ncbi:hypothetical protein HF846_13750 [Clostridium cadaveris]|uniref:hypothetical protein n=1 Tax=Clostridium cadaveris TaxID=1529 RepID=UPI00145941CD|nr:hypothetical protein [Clostridium cadaveris]NME65659.1 hypothetical protein [Clostridium cadaveris]
MGNFTKTIHISKLVVNPENYRFESVENEFEAIKTMLTEHNKEIKNLLKDILEFGLNPSDLLIVYNFDGNYITLEGNRRLTSLKIINDVNILTNIDNQYYKEYTKLLNRNSKKTSDDLTKIKCVIFDDIKEAERWVEIKHTNNNKGKGTIRWNTSQIRRYETKRSEDSADKKTTRSHIIIQLLKYIQDSSFYSDIIKQNLSMLPITTLERLLSDPHVRGVIGIEIEKNKIYKIYPDYEISKPLNKILSDLINKKIHVNDVYTKDKRIIYTSNFNINDKPNALERFDSYMPLENLIYYQKNTNNPQLNFFDNKSNSLDSNDKHQKETVKFNDINDNLIINNTTDNIDFNSNNNNISTTSSDNINISTTTSSDNNNISTTTSSDNNNVSTVTSSDNNNVSTVTSSDNINVSTTTSSDNINISTNTIINNSKKQKDKPDINKRKNLIPRSISISISNHRINQIYIELKRLEIDTYPNAVAVLFRVFLEITLDDYIESNNLKSVNLDSKLNKKVQECLSHLNSKKLISKEQMKPVNVCISDNNSVFSVNTFNSYVHNKHMYPDPTHLKNSWNSLEGFIIALLSNCK